MNILITGGSGFLGKHLIGHLQNQRNSVSILGRNTKSIEGVKRFIWNPAEQQMDEDALKDAECIIHLAGASLAEGRWTEKRKKEIIESRVKSGELIYQKLKNDKRNVKTFISASGVGIYGNTRSEWVDELSAPSYDYISEVCKAWESIAQKIASLGIRVVIIRIGIVLGEDGGALPVIAKPVKLFVGTALGSGDQYMSWIHIDDLCGIFLKACEDQSMKGVYNAVAPNPRTNAEFTRALALVLKRPLLLPYVPAFALKLALGEKAMIVLTGQRVLAKRLKLTGFQFQFRELSEALKDIYGKE